MTEKEIEYCKKWYDNILNEYMKSEIQAEKELYAKAKLDQMLRGKDYEK